MKSMKKFRPKVSERDFITGWTAVRVYNYALILCLDASLKTGPDLALET